MRRRAGRLPSVPAPPGWPFANRDGVDDMPARVGRRPLRPAIGPPLPQVGQQCLFQHAAALHKPEIDRLVRHVHGRIIRIRRSQPAIRPLERQLGRDHVQRRVGRQATAFRAPAARPRPPVSDRGPIPATAAVTPHFPTHRRGGAPQLPADLPQGLLGPRRGRSPPARTALGAPRASSAPRGVLIIGTTILWSVRVTCKAMATRM